MMKVSASRIEARNSVVGKIVGLILFTAIGGGCLYAALKNDTTSLFVVAIASFGIGLLCLVRILRPVILFAADDAGITVGKGLLRHTRTLVPWPQVVSIDEGSMQIMRGSVEQRTLKKVEVEAVVLEFDKSVDLGTTGYEGACPDGNKYSIQPKHFGSGTDVSEVVRVLRDMKEKSC